MKELDKNLKRKYSFSEYNQEWKGQFQAIRDFLSKVFGNKAVFIEHVGSTSVEGMGAKPVIDVLVGVEKMEAFESEKAQMTEAGYEWGENYIAPNTLIFFKTDAEGEKLENIHICEKGSEKAKQFLVMRDYLRVHPQRAKEYSDLKEKNVALYPGDYPAYRAAKAEYLQQLQKEAYEWVERAT